MKIECCSNCGRIDVALGPGNLCDDCWQYSYDTCDRCKKAYRFGEATMYQLWDGRSFCSKCFSELNIGPEEIRSKNE